MGGCAGSGGSSRSETDTSLAGVPTERAVAGDWDDLDAALEAEAESAEVAVMRSRRGPDRVVYALVSIEGKPGELIAVRGEEGRLTLSARIGRFGDSEREARLLRAVAGRLGRLRGVDVAPLD